MGIDPSACFWEPSWFPWKDICHLANVCVSGLPCQYIGFVLLISSRKKWNSYLCTEKFHYNRRAEFLSAKEFWYLILLLPLKVTCLIPFTKIFWDWNSLWLLTYNSQVLYTLSWIMFNNLLRPEGYQDRLFHCFHPNQQCVLLKRTIFWIWQELMG